MKKNSKAIKIALGIIVAINFIWLLKLPITYSKFSDENDNALVYNTQLYNMYFEYTMELSEASETKATFLLKFIKNRATADSTDTDKYDIIIPDKCEFSNKDIDTSGTVSAIDENNPHSRTITFNKDADKNHINRIFITCSVEKNSKLDFNVKINETIGKEKFTYVKYSYNQSYQDYLDEMSKIDSIITTPADKLTYDTLLNWIKEYSKTAGYYDQLLQYVQSVFKTVDDIKNENKFNSLPGFSIELDSNKTEYTFKALDNFVGYARTYAIMSSSSNNSNDLYFSTKAKLELNKAFTNYLNWYIYPNNSEAVNLVNEYISSKGGIYSILYDGNSALGITLYNGGIRINRNLLLSMAASYKENSPQIIYTTTTDMKNIFADEIKYFYSTIPSSIQGGIYRMVIDSITKNSTDQTPVQAFKDYFIYKSGNTSYFVKVESGRSGYNTFSITQLSIDIPSDMTITSSNTTDNKFTINIKHTTRDSVMNVATKFGEYFGNPINDTNLKVISDTTNEYIVEYTITK